MKFWGESSPECWKHAIDLTNGR